MKNGSRKFNPLSVIVFVIIVAAVIIVPKLGNRNNAENGVNQKTQTQSEMTSGEEKSDSASKKSDGASEKSDKSYKFRSEKYLNQHYEKHGKEMGFKSAKEYEEAASAVVNNKNALHKTEKEDGDDVYYLADTNEFVIVSGDGYLRTYFTPDAGMDYYNRQ